MLSSAPADVPVSPAPFGLQQQRSLVCNDELDTAVKQPCFTILSGEHSDSLGVRAQRELAVQSADSLQGSCMYIQEQCRCREARTELQQSGRRQGSRWQARVSQKPHPETKLPPQRPAWHSQPCLLWLLKVLGPNQETAVRRCITSAVSDSQGTSCRHATTLTSGLLAVRRSLRPALWMRLAISTTFRPAGPASDSTCTAQASQPSTPLLSHAFPACVGHCVLSLQAALVGLSKLRAGS